MDGTVRMAIAEPTFITQLVPNHYELSAHGPFSWLHRLLWRALHKMGALRCASTEVASYKTYALNADRIAERVEEARGRLWRRAGDGPTRLLIGPPQMAELMRDASLMDLSMHASPVELPCQKYRGLTVEIIPHMDGVLVL